MHVYRQRNPVRVRQLVVLDGNDFESLSFFWSLRARTSTRGNSPLVIGVPLEALSAPDQLRSLSDWVKRVPDGAKPDVFVVAKKEHQASCRGHARARLSGGGS